MFYKPPVAVYIASYKELLDQSDAGNSLFSSEIILINIINGSLDGMRIHVIR